MRRDDIGYSHEVMPPEVQEALKRAARTPVTDADPMARRKAIARAEAWARWKYPELFREPE